LWGGVGLSQQTVEEKIEVLKRDLARYQNGTLTKLEKRLVVALKRQLKRLEKETQDKP
jgi:hypothetical protein